MIFAKGESLKATLKFRQNFFSNNFLTLNMSLSSTANVPVGSQELITVNLHHLVVFRVCKTFSDQPFNHLSLNIINLEAIT